MDLNQINIKEIKKFGLILATILLAVGCIHLLKGHRTVFMWLTTFSAVFFILSALFTKTIIPVYVVFTKIAHAIGWFNTRLILCIIFYLIVTPFGLVMRLFKKDPLEKKIDKKMGSYWLKKEADTADITRYEKAF